MDNLIESIVVLNEENKELPFESEVFAIVGQNWLSILVATSEDATLEIIKGIREVTGYPEYKYTVNITAGNEYDGLIPISGKSLKIKITSEEEDATFTGFATVRKNF